jgi:Zn-dependent metalloprotease
MLKKSMLLAAGLVFVHGLTNAQQKMNSNVPYSGITLPVSEGRIHANLRGKAVAAGDVSKNLAAMLGLSSNHTFRKVAETTDQLGITNTDYQQYYLNVKVDNGIVLVHSKGGIVNSINGSVAQLGTLSVTPSISAQQASAFAKKASLVTRQINQYPAELVVINTSSEDSKGYALAWKVRVDGTDARKNLVMVNMFVDAATGKIINEVNLINDADVTGTGNTIYSGDRSFTIDSTGQSSFRLRDNGRKIETYNGAGVEETSTGFASNVDFNNTNRTWDMFKMFSVTRLYKASDSLLAGLGQTNNLVFTLLKGTTLATAERASDFRRLPITSSANLPYGLGSFYNLIDPLQTYYGAYIKYDTTGSFNYEGIYQLTDLTVGTRSWTTPAGDSGTYTLAMKKNPAVDVHWGMQKTHDFYATVLNRNSYDGLGSVIKNYVDAGYRNNAGAAPPPYNFMQYGMGDGVIMGPVVTLDVMGHEFTHMVTDHNGHGGLQYQGESGALNESFSDIFGASIEFYAKGSAANWNIGEGIMLQAPGFLRSMANPKLTQNPDTYKGQYWKNTANTSPQNDWGGVHYNSGVQNKWYYLLVNGGTGTNDKGDSYNVIGIGLDKAEKIAYRNLTTYITPASDYLAASEGSLEAALDLFGNNTNSPEYKAVKEAWYAVGIGTKPTTAINEIAVGESDLKVYPNPATGRVTIASALNETLQAQIVNVVGVPVMNITVTKGLNPVDISGLAKGMYMIRYNTGSNGFVQKLSVL